MEIALALGAVALLRLTPRDSGDSSGKCTECAECGSQCRGFEDDPYRNAGGIHPVSSPYYNLRCAAIQMVLLEDHLNDPMKRCADCIKKHFLCIEGLLNEAISLDKAQKLGDLPAKAASQVRNLAHEWRHTDSSQWRDIAQELRKIRKELQDLSFDAPWATVVKK